MLGDVLAPAHWNRWLWGLEGRHPDPCLNSTLYFVTLFLNPKNEQFFGALSGDIEIHASIHR